MGLHDLSLSLSGVGGTRYLLFGVSDVLMTLAGRFTLAGAAATAAGILGLSAYEHFSRKAEEATKEFNETLKANIEALKKQLEATEKTAHARHELSMGMRDIARAALPEREAGQLKSREEFLAESAKRGIQVEPGLQQAALGALTKQEMQRREAPIRQ